MSEFDHIVQKQRDMMKAEEWALKVKSLHAHSLTSMWYDTRNHDGSVMDTEYFARRPNYGRPKQNHNLIPLQK